MSTATKTSIKLNDKAAALFSSLKTSGSLDVESVDGRTLRTLRRFKIATVAGSKIKMTKAGEKFASTI